MSEVLPRPNREAEADSRQGSRGIGEHSQAKTNDQQFRFVDATARLNWFLPTAIILALAIVATTAETLLGVLLILGWKTRITSLVSAVLLATFALTMTMALG
jgi:uncharacterized membrane protein YphA (DoxX/SURF4 family)